MLTTVGIFYADLAGGQTVYRIGSTALPVSGTEVAGLLPALVRTPFAARSLTEPDHFDSILQGALHKGWQTANFVFEFGAWYPLLDLLGKRGARLECFPVAEAEALAAASAPTDYQQKKIHDMTKSHVFDKDREDIRDAAACATAEEAGAIITALAEQLRIRPRLHPVGWRGRR